MYIKDSWIVHDPYQDPAPLYRHLFPFGDRKTRDVRSPTLSFIFLIICLFFVTVHRYACPFLLLRPIFFAVAVRNENYLTVPFGVTHIVNSSLDSKVMRTTDPVDKKKINLVSPITISYVGVGSQDTVPQDIEERGRKYKINGSLHANVTVVT